ncbi:hypothetical protein AZ34_10360 [Hylemonella gracilis str. Niagara R]|uniref:Uncharacterized protein n=1 Tax=Hylemonella gracilis str. Niagara R TaxID=1458275 RepID=A0A016XH68_9BURK|nr:hypothetical protein AZ34_10360 [Hylemonella gracilis str. Niagara R]
MPGVEAFDIERDARTYDGPYPVVAHPPCRSWGALRHFSQPRADERNLARLAAALVREFGGVLEHPANSGLWRAQNLPRPGEACDGYGGWTLPIQQWQWGHKAAKATWLYIVGCAPGDIPDMPPFRMGEPEFVVASSKKTRPEITKAEREHTPPALASWLVELARRCALNQQDRRQGGMLA